MISDKYWPELSNIGKKELGTVVIKKVGDIEFFALCCHSLKNGWGNQQEIIEKCFNAIPGDEPVASICIGTGIVGTLTGSNFSLIREGMNDSEKKIILYYNI